jgi:hypothetical protein
MYVLNSSSMDSILWWGSLCWIGSCISVFGQGYESQASPGETPCGSQGSVTAAISIGRIPMWHRLQCVPVAGHRPVKTEQWCRGAEVLGRREIVPVPGRRLQVPPDQIDKRTNRPTDITMWHRLQSVNKRSRTEVAGP